MIAMLTAALEIKFVNAPILKVIGERKDAHVINQMQLTCNS
jgi:hypothetical protein